MKRAFIMQFAEEQKIGKETPYFYDERTNLNVIRTSLGNIPIVSGDDKYTKADTLTEVRGEDSDILQSVLAAETHTFVNREGSDESCSLLNAASKTAISRESDD